MTNNHVRLHKKGRGRLTYEQVVEKMNTPKFNRDYYRNNYCTENRPSSPDIEEILSLIRVYRTECANCVSAYDAAQMLFFSKNIEHIGCLVTHNLYTEKQIADATLEEKKMARWILDSWDLQKLPSDLILIINKQKTEIDTYLKSSNYIPEMKISPKYRDDLLSVSISQATTSQDKSDSLDYQTLISSQTLICGAEGSGKTTKLMEYLSMFLAAKIVSPHDRKTPIYLKISDWSSNKYSSIEEWLYQIIKVKFGLGSNQTKQMITSNNLILLLDGLDEIKEEDNMPWINAMNRFIDTYSNLPLCLTSRLDHYEKLKKNKGLNVNHVFELELLPEHIRETIEDIKRSKKRSKSHENTEFISKLTDEDLKKNRLDNPLRLSICIEQDIDLQSLQPEQLNKIDIFLIKKSYKRRKLTTEEITRLETLLSWIAKNLQHPTDVFHQDQILPTWKLPPSILKEYHFQVCFVLFILISSSFFIARGVALSFHFPMELAYRVSGITAILLGMISAYLYTYILKDNLFIPVFGFLVGTCIGITKYICYDAVNETPSFHLLIPSSPTIGIFYLAIFSASTLPFDTSASIKKIEYTIREWSHHSALVGTCLGILVTVTLGTVQFFGSPAVLSTEWIIRTFTLIVLYIPFGFLNLRRNQYNNTQVITNKKWWKQHGFVKGYLMLSLFFSLLGAVVGGGPVLVARGLGYEGLEDTLTALCIMPIALFYGGLT